MTSPTESDSFFKELLKRRVLPIVGIYLGATVALMEFSGMVIERYGFNDNIVDYVLAIMLTFIPAMLILAWRHGAPGKDEWGKVEKIGVPVNVAAVVGVIFFLGSQSAEITPTQTEAVSNNSIPQPALTTERAIIPRLGVLFFDDPNATEDNDWESYAATFLLTNQLRQNIGLHTTSLFDTDFFWQIKRAGYQDGKNLPFSLARRVASNNDLHYFLKGTLIRDKGYQLSLTLYDTKTAKEVKQMTVEAETLFQLTDTATAMVQNISELALNQAANLNQIPTSEFTTSNHEALKAYIQSLLAKTFDNDYEAASKLAEKAVELDPNFALGYFYLGGLAADRGLLEKSNQYFKRALNFNYKLTPRLRLAIRAAIYATEQNTQEQVNLYRNWIELYPNDYQPKNHLAFILKFRSDDRDEIIRLLKESLLINPAQPEVYESLGEAYLAQQKYAEAKEAFQQLRKLRPESSNPFLKLGYIELTMGNLDEAEKYFSQASLIESDKVMPITALANLAFRRGDLATMRRKFEEAALISQAPRQLAILKKNEMAVAELSGKPSEAYSLLQEFQQIITEFENPIETLFGAYVSQTQVYIAANKQNIIEEQLNELKQTLDKSLRPLVDFASLFIQINNKNIDEAKQTHAMLSDVVDTFQLRQLRYLLLFTAGRIAEEEKDWSTALARLNDAEQNILLYPNFTREIAPLIQDAKVRVLRKSGQLEQAIEQAEDYLKKWPYHPFINMEYAKSLLDIERHDDAKVAIDRVKLILKGAEPECFACEEIKQLEKLLIDSK